MKNKTYEYIVFDLDGTLTEPSAGLVASFRYALRKMGVDYGTDASLRRFIGPPLFSEWQREFGFSYEEATRALLLFREYFAVYGWWDNFVYPGVPEMLKTLRARGKRVALATSKPEHFAVRILKYFGIYDLFDFVGGAASDKERDKKWEVLRYTLDALGVGSTEEELSACILVGDRKFDAEGAALCGIDALGVTYGHGSKEEIAAADFALTADSVSAIADLLP